MTILAFKSEETGVNRGVSMTLYANLGRVFEHLVLMAGITFDFGMLSIQHEEIGVVKIAHTINTVVTVQTGRPELVHVLAHEGSTLFALSVASLTNLRAKFVDTVLVACLAGHCCAIVILGVQR